MATPRQDRLAGDITGSSVWEPHLNPLAMLATLLVHVAACRVRANKSQRLDVWVLQHAVHCVMSAMHYVQHAPDAPPLPSCQQDAASFLTARRNLTCGQGPSCEHVNVTCTHKQMHAESAGAHHCSMSACINGRAGRNYFSATARLFPSSAIGVVPDGKRVELRPPPRQ